MRTLLMWMVAISLLLGCAHLETKGPRPVPGDSYSDMMYHFGEQSCIPYSEHRIGRARYERFKCYSIDGVFWVTTRNSVITMLSQFNY